jgi:hypothetical protein
MAVNIEVKQLIKGLTDRIAELEKRPTAEQVLMLVKQALDNHFLASKPLSAPLKTPKTCPHCGVAPAYFFHVKNCPKKKNNGDDRNGNPGNS